MAMHIKNAIILYTCLIMNHITGNALESRSNTCYSLVIRAMYMCQLKQKAKDRAIWCFYFDAMHFMYYCREIYGIVNLHVNYIAVNYMSLNADI